MTKRVLIATAALFAGCGPAVEVRVTDGAGALTLSGNDVIFEATFVHLPETSVTLTGASATVGAASGPVTCLRPDRTALQAIHAGDSIVCFEQGEAFGPELNGSTGQAAFELQGEVQPSGTVVRGYVLRQVQTYTAGGTWAVDR